jgi:hypothetical protein
VTAWRMNSAKEPQFELLVTNRSSGSKHVRE